MVSKMPGSERIDHELPHNYLSGDQQLDRFQRLETLSLMEGGFLPATSTEVTEVMALEAVLHHPGGAAKHLAEVVIHQNKANTTDSMRAARKITRNYISFAQDAHKAEHDLGLLNKAISIDQDINPELKLNLVVEDTQPGLLPLLRFFDLSILRETGRVDKLPYDPQKVEYIPTNGGIMFYLGLAMESWRVQQARKKLPEAITNETNRLDFWTTRLKEVQRSYPVLKQIVTEGLDKIYGQQAS